MLIGTFEIAVALLGLVIVVLIGQIAGGTSMAQSVDWSVLLVIGAALGIGKALDTSGAADAIGSNLIGVIGNNPWLALLAVYFITSLVNLFCLIK